MLFMVIERFKDSDMIPVGTSFEIVPVLRSAETREIVAAYLDAPQ
jgi:hypothetical protein